MHRAFALLAACLLAASPFPTATATVYTANEDAASISAIDVSAGSVDMLPLDVNPHNVQISSDGTLLFATGMHEDRSMPEMPMSAPGQLVVLGTQPELHVLWSLPVGGGPAHVVADPQAAFAYVTLSGEDAVAVVDLRTHTVVARIAVGAYPHGLRANADWTRLYVADLHADAVSVVDVAARKEIARLSVGKAPLQVALDPKGRWFAVTLSGENAVAVVDLAMQRVARKIAVGRNPAQLFVSPDGTRLVVANQGTKERPDDRVMAVDTNTMRVAATVHVGPGAHGVAIDGQGRYAYVTDSFAARLSVIDLRAIRVTREFATGAGPNGVTVSY